MLDISYGKAARLAEIRQLRDELYLKDGVRLSVEEGSLDSSSWHVTSWSTSGLSACLRYTTCQDSWGRPAAVVSAWASRGARHSIRVLKACYELGFLHGGVLAFATATVRHGSSSVLEAMGGEVLAEYDDPTRGGMKMLVFDTALPAPGPKR